MKYVRELTGAELITLQSAQKSHSSARIRNRAYMIILSNKGYHLQELADICQMTRQTVSAVTDKWEQFGLTGSDDNPRPGKSRSLTPEDEDIVSEMAKQEPRSINMIIAALEEQRGKKAGKSAVRRVIRKKRVRKRIRKSPKGKRDEEEFRKAQEEIRHSEQRGENGEIGLYYYDEAGSDLTPCVPYAWQPIGGYAEVPSAKSRSLSVLASVNKNNDCMPFIFETRVDTDVVIACSDRFGEKLTQKTFVITDNAPVRKSKKFFPVCPNGRRKGLTRISHQILRTWFGRRKSEKMLAEISISASY